MSGSFDPYYEWLAIAPKDQPPTHYRLLGVELFESDSRLIETASEQRMLLVRTRQIGKQSELSQRILNELTQARLTLLDPEKRAAYDAGLRKSLGLAAPKERKLTVAKALPDKGLAVIAEAVPLPKVAPARPEGGKAESSKSPPNVVVAASTPTFSNQPAPAAPPLWQNPLVLGGAGTGLLVLIGLVIWIALPSASPPVVVNPPPGPARPPQPAPADPRSAPAPVRPTPGPQPPLEDPFKQVAPRPAPQPEIPSPGPVGPRDPVVTPPVAPPPMPMPVERPRLPAAPAAAEAAAALKEVRELFSSDLTAAKTPEQKRDLSARMLQIARDEAAGSASQFAVFQLARELAAASLDPATVATACEALAEKFDLLPLALQQESLVAGLEGAGSIAAKRPLAEATLDCIDQLLAADEYQLAADALKPLSETARALKDKDLTQAVADRRKLGQEMMAKFREVQPALETLKQQPDDPAANLLVGRYVALVKGDFERGLPMLAKSGDAALVNLAKLEQPPPQEAKQQIALADAWHAFVPSAGAAEKAMVEERAALWFGVAGDGLAGLEKARVEKRLAELPEPKARAGGAVASTAFLDDLPEKVVQPVASVSPVAKHGMNGLTGRPITWEGAPVKHSIYQHPPSRRTSILEYHLGGKYKRLQTVAALLPDGNRTGLKGDPVVFRVVGDGKTLWQSRNLMLSGDKQACDISLARVNTLRLETQSVADGPSGYVCWLEPQLAARPVPSSMHRPPLIVSIPPRDPEGSFPLVPSIGAGPEAGSEGVVYLDDLPELAARNLLFSLGRHGEIDAKANVPGGRVTWKGERVAHALFTHPSGAPPVEVEFPLQAKFERFQATAARLSANTNGFAIMPITLRVLGDGRVLWTSKPLDAVGMGQDVDVSVRGVRVLKLEVAAPQGIAFAWAAWISPKLTGGKGLDAGPSGGDVFLDDLPEQNVAGLNSPLLKHGKLPLNGGIGDKDGRPYEHSLFMQPRTAGTCSVEYRLDGKYATFSVKALLCASPMLQPNTTRATPLTFRLLGDGREMWSRALAKVDASTSITAAVQGISVLRLEVSCTDKSDDAWGLWLNPQLSGGAESVGPAGLLSMGGGIIGIFLDDLATDRAEGLDDELLKHGKLPQNRSLDMGGGLKPKHSLAMRPRSGGTASVEYRLNGQHTNFEAACLLAPSPQFPPGTRRATPVRFRLLADGRPIWDSNIDTAGMSFANSVPVAGVNTLRLEVACSDDNRDALGVWITPKLTNLRDAPPVAAGPGEAFLDDLPEQNVRNLRFTLGKHGRTDPQIISPNKKIYWKGESPSHALMIRTATASTAQVEYELGGKYSTFMTTAAFLVPPTRQGIPGGSKLTYRVVGDGKVLWSSQPLDTGESEECSVSIAGVRTLRLEIECPRQGDYTWAAWLLPKVGVGMAQPR